MQSWHQKKLFESLGQKTWLFEYRTNTSSVRSLVTKVQARRGTFLCLPYGPFLDGKDPALGFFFDALKGLARRENAAFIRMSPYWEESSDTRTLSRALGFRKAPLHMLAETLWLLDLGNKSEEELMTGIEKKHRNLIRRAMKDGVEIKTSTSSEAVERFLDLHWQTVERLGFTPYPKDYFRQQVQLFATDDQVLVIEAWVKDQLLSSAIIMYYGKVGAYHHGASSSDPEHRKIPASYLVQWEAIREARRRNCMTYNFWGISSDKNPKHPFHGITHFKTGFGGRQYNLLPCQDLPINPKYYLNWSVETLRKWKRGF